MFVLLPWCFAAVLMLGLVALCCPAPVRPVRRAAVVSGDQTVWAAAFADWRAYFPTVAGCGTACPICRQLRVTNP